MLSERTEIRIAIFSVLNKHTDKILEDGLRGLKISGVSIDFLVEDLADLMEKKRK